MQVAVFHGPGRIAIEEALEGELGDNDVRIAIARCGICGSDISMTSGSPFDYLLGKALGHEFAGEVIERGRAAAKFKIGDKLAVLPSGPCGQCEMCRQGRPLFCSNGESLFGGFASPEQLRAALGAPMGTVLPPLPATSGPLELDPSREYGEAIRRLPVAIDLAIGRQRQASTLPVSPAGSVAVAGL